MISINNQPACSRLRRQPMAGRQSTINNRKGFSLIELLVVISIIGILAALSLVALQSTRAAGRDTRRKTDLEQIRSGLELYYSDCAKYPIGTSLSSPLVGDGSSASCSSSNTYISSVPKDPQSPTRDYYYSSTSGVTYELCSALEQVTASAGCGGSCGSGVTCTYKTTNP